MPTDRRPSFTYLCAAALCVVAGPAASQHVHGVIELGIVLEDNALAVTLRAPLSDLVGFEHEPENDAQADRLKQAAALLADADAMFGLPDRAGCETHDISIDGPAFLLELMETGEHHEHGPGHESETDDEDDHKNDHDHTADAHDDHADHSGDSHGGHSEAVAEYVWECAAASEIEALDVRFLTELQRVDKVSVQVLTPTGARYFDAGRDLDSIAISAP